MQYETVYRGYCPDSFQMNSGRLQKLSAGSGTRFLIR